MAFEDQNTLWGRIYRTLFGLERGIAGWLKTSGRTNGRWNRWSGFLLLLMILLCSGCGDAIPQEPDQAKQSAKPVLLQIRSAGAWINKDGDLKIIVDPAVSSADLKLLADSAKQMEVAVELRDNLEWKGNRLAGDYYDADKLTKDSNDLAWSNTVRVSEEHQRIYIDYSDVFEEMDQWFDQDDCPFSRLTVHLKSDGSDPGQDPSIGIECNAESVGCEDPNMISMGYKSNIFCICDQPNAEFSPSLGVCTLQG